MDHTLEAFGQGFEERLAAAVRLLRIDDACTLVEEMFGWFTEHETGPEQIRILVYSCAYAVTQIAVERNAIMSDGQLTSLLTRLPAASEDMDSDRMREGLLELLRETLALLSEERRTHTRAYLYEVKSYLDEHFDQRISLKQLAERVFVDAFYLGKEFHRQFGCSVNEYQNRLRIERAAEMLETTQLRLHEIASAVGYNNYNNFYHNFRRITGSNPEQRRK